MLMKYSYLFLTLKVKYLDIIKDFVSLVCKGLNSNIYKEMKIVGN